MAYVDLDEASDLLGGRLVRSTPGIVRFRRRDYLGDPQSRSRTPCVRSSQGAGRRAGRPDPPAHSTSELRALLQPGQLLLLLRSRRRTGGGDRRRGDEHALGRAPRVRPGREAEEIPKALHVSPFMGMDQRYSFNAPAPGEFLAVHIESSEASERVFDATLGLRRRPFNARAMARITARYPAATLRMLALIYGHALALKLKGVPVQPSPASAAVMTERVARRIVFGLLRRLRTGQLTVVEHGSREVFGSGTPAAIVYVNTPRVWAMLLRGSRGLGRSYSEGLWDTPDLTAVVRVAARNVEGLDTARRRLAPIRAPYQRVRGLFGRNTPSRSRKDIAAHYDLGNDLFARMLDPTLMYSCAVFSDADATLEQASIAKLELVCEKLALGPDDHVLEIGTGWGGFAVHAATTRGCRVTTTTLSRDQYEVARTRVRDGGVEHLVELRLDDYRDLRGSYDKLVSVEMIEAVGWRDFGTFFDRCSRLLKRDGAMLLQAITMDDRAYEVEKSSESFIRTYIFPNGCLPSLAVIARCVKRNTDLRTVHIEDLTPHYAETLRRWRANFEAAAEELEGHGYDERFRRLWLMYLAYCEAGFDERRIGLVQAVLAKPRWRGDSLDTAGPRGPWLAGEHAGAQSVEQERRAA